MTQPCGTIRMSHMQTCGRVDAWTRWRGRSLSVWLARPPRPTTTSCLQTPHSLSTDILKLFNKVDIQLATILTGHKVCLCHPLTDRLTAPQLTARISHCFVPKILAGHPFEPFENFASKSQTALGPSRLAIARSFQRVLNYNNVHLIIAKLPQPRLHRLFTFMCTYPIINHVTVILRSPARLTACH